MSKTNDTSTETGGFARRGMLGGAALVAALGAMGARAPAALAATEAFPQHLRWKFVFVNHVTTNPFFVPTQYGIQDAAALLGVDYQWTGSQTSNAAEMVNDFNGAIAAKADAIAVSLVDLQAFNRPIERAHAAGIPVFAYNADAPKSGREAYIGQDLYAAGAHMGERIASLVESGRIALFIATPGQLNIQPRIDGAQDVLKKSGKKYEIDVIATGPTVDEELSRIGAYYIGHQDVKGMFAVDAGSTEGVSQVIRKNDLAAKGVKGGGFDMLATTLTNINDGYLDFAIDQQAYLQGFYTAIEMFAYLVSGGLSGPSEINTGLKFVTKANVAPYLATQTRYEGNSDKSQIVARSGAIKS
jgi:simple sugar transport system substrate-binding protein